ncbi:MAG: hypothetical protein IPM42_08150 [Saprospiraceae bacterium]|nr:hypothetical protein [Saprospiraceae bacterium]
MRFLKLYLFLSIGFVFIIGCSKDEDQQVDCTGVTPTYTNDISKIFNASCATTGCHSAVFPANGINLSSYETSKSASLNGKVLQSVKHSSGAFQMPQDGPKLSDASIKLIECWIKNGAPE